MVVCTSCVLLVWWASGSQTGVLTRWVRRWNEREEERRNRRKREREKQESFSCLSSPQEAEGVITRTDALPAVFSYSLLRLFSLKPSCLALIINPQSVFSYREIQFDAHVTAQQEIQHWKMYKNSNVPHSNLEKQNIPNLRKRKIRVPFQLNFASTRLLHQRKIKRVE